jgi:ABC-type methionine transport system ATPase subunit
MKKRRYLKQKIGFIFGEAKVDNSKTVFAQNVMTISATPKNKTAKRMIKFLQQHPSIKNQAV